MKRIVIVTSSPRGMAALCIPALASCPDIEIAGVVLATGGPKKNVKFYWRKFRKICRIGLLGALNGRRMRSWYACETEDVRVLCKKHGLNLVEVAHVNSDEAIRHLSAMKVDLGLSLGNGYISSRVFSIPRMGMINVHSEILPDYQNAQSIIWPIYNFDPQTGFTIHEINAKIDAGRILLQRRYSLVFYPTLEQTVRLNRQRVERDIPSALVEVVSRLEDFQASAVDQGRGRSYTTPTFWQFLRMVRNNGRLYEKNRCGEVCE